MAPREGACPMLPERRPFWLLPLWLPWAPAPSQRTATPAGPLSGQPGASSKVQRLPHSLESTLPEAQRWPAAPGPAWLKLRPGSGFSLFSRDSCKIGVFCILFYALSLSLGMDMFLIIHLVYVVFPVSRDSCISSVLENSQLVSLEICHPLYSSWGNLRPPLGPCR